MKTHLGIGKKLNHKSSPEIGKIKNFPFELQSEIIPGRKPMNHKRVDLKSFNELEMFATSPREKIFSRVSGILQSAS